MKQTINLYQFRDAFQAIRPDNFSYEGLEVLFDWFVDLEYNDDDGNTINEIELDVIAICCEFSEYTIDEFFEQFDIDMDQFNDERDGIEWYLAENGTMIGWVNVPDKGWHVMCHDF
jgi:hypothetical protein